MLHFLLECLHRNQLSCFCIDRKQAASQIFQALLKVTSRIGFSGEADTILDYGDELDAEDVEFGASRSPFWSRHRRRLRGRFRG